MSATERVLIVVTQEDIDKGDPVSPWKGPVALAAARALAVRHVAVNESGLFFTESDGRPVSVRLPRRVKWRVTHFDNFLGMRPFSFEIEVPA